MGDLIFVPELGLLSGKNQHLKARMWYPLPHSSKIRIRTTSNYKRELKGSPFAKIQRLLPLKTPKKAEQQTFPSSLIVHLQPRPLSMVGRERIKNSEEINKNFEAAYRKIESDSFSSALHVNTQHKAMTISGNRKQKQSVEIASIPDDIDNILNLPTLNQRPLRINSE